MCTSSRSSVISQNGRRAGYDLYCTGLHGLPTCLSSYFKTLDSFRPGKRFKRPEGRCAKRQCQVVNSGVEAVPVARSHLSPCSEQSACCQLGRDASGLAFTRFHSTISRRQSTLLTRLRIGACDLGAYKAHLEPARLLWRRTRDSRTFPPLPALRRSARSPPFLSRLKSLSLAYLAQHDLKLDFSIYLAKVVVTL